MSDKMNPDDVVNNWSSVCENDAVPEEIQKLATDALKDPKTKQDVLENVAMDQMLRKVDHIESTEDAFVDQVMNAIPYDLPRSIPTTKVDTAEVPKVIPGVTPQTGSVSPVPPNQVKPVHPSPESNIPKVIPVITAPPTAQAPTGGAIPVRPVNPQPAPKPTTSESAQRPRWKENPYPNPEPTASTPAAANQPASNQPAVQKPANQKPANPQAVRPAISTPPAYTRPVPNQRWKVNLSLAVVVSAAAMICLYIAFQAQDGRDGNQSPTPIASKSTDSDATKLSDRSPSVTDDSKQQPPKPRRADSASLANVVNDTGVKWIERPSQPELGQQNLAIRSGELRLDMANGAEVTISGPAQFRLSDHETLILHAGKLSANVPPQAVNFTVLTPSSKIIDLGTKFDVDVGLEGDTGVLVTEGVVTLETLEGGNPRWVLRKGDYKWVDESGGVHDWNLTLTLSEEGRGTARLNGETYELDSLENFEQAKTDILREFSRYESEFRRLNRDQKKDFRGIIDFNTNKTRLDDVDQLASAREQTSKLLDQLARGNPNVPEIKIGDDLKINSDGVKVGDAIKINSDGIKVGESIKVDRKEIKVGDAIKINPDGIKVGDSVKIDPGGIKIGGIDIKSRGYKFGRDGIKMPSGMTIGPGGMKVGGFEIGPGGMKGNGAEIGPGGMKGKGLEIGPGGMKSNGLEIGPGGMKSNGLDIGPGGIKFDPDKLDPDKFDPDNTLAGAKRNRQPALRR